MSDIEKLGRAGETIITNYYSKRGCRVKASVDQYDSAKDLIIITPDYDSFQCEVKTQVPFVTKNAFSFKPNQLHKCKNADIVFFVSIPNKKQPHHSEGSVWMVPGKEMQYYDGETNDGRKMIFIPITQPKMIKIFDLTEDECIILQRYSKSGWNND